MVLAFDPFFGFFAGTLYDSVITGLGRLGTYRMGTLATLLAAGAASALFRSESGRLVFVGKRLPGGALLAGSAAVLSVVHTPSGPPIGPHSTTASIRRAPRQ